MLIIVKKCAVWRVIMKELGKCRAVIALLCFTATVFSGCGNRTEAVITDGEGYYNSKC